MIYKRSGIVMKKTLSVSRRVAFVCLVLIGLMGLAGMATTPKEAGIPMGPRMQSEFSPEPVQREMIELRYLPTNWWGF
jgi:hypothetical protein